MNEDIRINDEALGIVNNVNELNRFFEEMERGDIVRDVLDEKSVQKIEEIKRSIDEHTEQRARIVQEMLKEKEKTPSLIKSIVDRMIEENKKGGTT